MIKETFISGRELQNISNKKLCTSQIFRKQRYRMWHEDGKCFWCGTQTIYIDDMRGIRGNKIYSEIIDLLATIDHVYSRLEPKERRSGNNIRVLCCKKCNEIRGTIAEELFLKKRRKQC